MIIIQGYIKTFFPLTIIFYLVVYASVKITNEKLK